MKCRLDQNSRIFKICNLYQSNVLIESRLRKAADSRIIQPTKLNQYPFVVVQSSCCVQFQPDQIFFRDGSSLLCIVFNFRFNS